MEKVAVDVGKAFIQWLASKGWGELKYLLEYKSYVEDFENERGRLSDEVERVRQRLGAANKKNKTLVDPRVKGWLERAEKLVQHDPQPTKCLGLCTNCFSQIAQAKKIEKLMKEQIPNLIAEVKEFPEEVASAAGVPGMEYHSQEFMSFESRKANFEKLKKALAYENNYMIGLQGSGGTGKSTMAIEVGKQFEKSNSFDKVIFIEVSTPVDEKTIRDDIAKKLELPLEEEKLSTHAQQIWNRIANVGKLLIILDNVWEKLNLKNMGIQPRFDSKGRYCVLLTTRYKNVCTQMSCQETIELEALPEEDAMKLFLFHAMEIGQGCPGNLKNVVVDIVNECGRSPVIVVAMAKTLKNWPVKDWHHALTTLKSADEPSRLEIVDEDEDVMKFYKSLKLSYDHLKDEKTQKLFLLCSTFPKAHEIPIELLSRIAIGSGTFGKIKKYDTARSQVCKEKNNLINSSLLLKANEECVKLHDVIRKVALEIANGEIQVVMDSKTDLKENMKYSSWIMNGFPNRFSGRKLKVLLVWLNTNGSLEVLDAFFGGMKKLRVLLLHSKIEYSRTLALSLPESIQSLKEIRTLSLKNWELGDISMLMINLQKLESLELTNCSFIELPDQISKLNKLIFLCLKRCSFEMNNFPFEVIANCSHLEELYYVSNDDGISNDMIVPQITYLPQYKIYHIDGSDFSAFDSSQLNTSIERCFKPRKLQRIFSKEIIKSLATRAEILELEGDYEIGWNNLIPSIVSMGDRAMDDLIKLSLKKCSEMKCLILTEHPQLKSGATFFSELVELQLIEVNVREICYGSYPHGFLKQLKKLELKNCQQLGSTLFDGKLELGNLNSIYIEDCSMTYLFHPSTAQSLMLLETLKIVKCSKLKNIIKDEGSYSIKEIVDDKDPNPRSHDSMFQQMKLLHVESCNQLEFILPICYCEDLPLLEMVKLSKCNNLRYVFDQYPKEGGLRQMQHENTLRSLKVMFIEDVPLFANAYPECYLPQKSTTNTNEGLKENDKGPSCNFSWNPVSCFLMGSSASQSLQLFLERHTEHKQNRISPNLSETEAEVSQEDIENDSTTSEQNNSSPNFSKSEEVLKEIVKEDSTTNSNLPNLTERTKTSANEIVEEELCTTPASTSDMGKYVGNRVHGIFTPPLYPCNLREMNIGDISNLRSLFSVSIASSMPLLQELAVWKCDELEHIVMEEVDGRHHMNNSSIFPNLSTIEIRKCDELEYVFPASCSRNLVHLKSVRIYKAPLLEYVFGKSCDDDNSPHENKNTEIDLSALGKLGLEKVPNMISMCPENYYVKAVSLRDINFRGCPQLPISSFIDLSVDGDKGQEQLSQKKLIGMQLCNLKRLCIEFLDMETIYDLERLQISSSVNSSLDTLALRGMDKLINICMGPKNLRLSFNNLVELYIYECHQLKFILFASISRSLPYLRLLCVSECEELERIIEEDDDDQECCFPNLHTIFVLNCKRLKCLFSISTCGSLPQLSALYIENATELDPVFELKQGASQGLDIKHVFPNLFVICLERLPNLYTICPSINFQAVICREVQDCPNISITSTDTEFFGSYWDWLEKSERNKDNMDGPDLFEKLFTRVREVAEKTIKRDLPKVEQHNGSSNIKEIVEASDEESPESTEAIGESDEESLESEADEIKDSEQTNEPVKFTATCYFTN